jgi:cytochrome c
MKPTKWLLAAALTPLLAGAGIARADDAAVLAQKYLCTGCHAIDKKTVGPAYKDVAAKYRGNKEAESLLVKKVLEGGSGVWGTVPMPPNKGRVKDDEARILVKWVLAQ